MTHIRIADLLMKKHPGLTGAEFVIGSIAPDCGKINPDGVSYVPDKDITHFGRYRAGREYGRLLSLINKENQNFFLGYYAHILTDDLWITNILLPKKAQYLKRFPDFYHFIMTQRDNWFRLDEEYAASRPGNTALDIFYATDEMPNIFLDFQPYDGLTEHINKVKEHYASFKPGEDNYPYLTAHELDGFITYAYHKVSDKISEQLTLRTIDIF